MGTHPIFESDFDCLTGRRRSCSQKLKKMRYVLPIFSLNSAVMMPPMPVPLRQFSLALALMLTKRNLPPFPPVVVRHPLPAVQPQPVEPPKKKRRRRPKNRPRAKTKIWDSVSSIKPEAAAEVIDSYRCLFQTFTLISTVF